MDAEEAVAREAMRETIARYNQAGDRGRIDELLQCFTEDGVLAISGEEPLEGRAPHAALGCLGCHREGPDVVRGGGHGFRASPGSPLCGSCHTAPPARGSLAARVRDLAERLRRRAGWEPPAERVGHADSEGLVTSDTPLGRAARNVALVLADSAAEVHNAAYARALLDAAEAALGGR